MKILCLILFSSSLWAKLNVVTTTTNLKSLVEVIGGDKVSVYSLAKGSQDPHFLEAKPSYMVRVAKADLLVQIGLGLEDAWLPLIIRGARNPELRPGQKRHFFAHLGVELLEVEKGMVTRADGDVHPEGNPHFMLDPLRASIVGESLAKKLGQLDHENSEFYINNAKRFTSSMKELVKRAGDLLKGSNTRIITYHKTMNYFNQRFNLKNLGYLEPKPGIPPTAKHIMALIKTIKEERPKTILVENYYDPSVAHKVLKEFNHVTLNIVPVAVDGSQEVPSLRDLYIALLRAVSGESKWKP